MHARIAQIHEVTLGPARASRAVTTTVAPLGAGASSAASATLPGLTNATTATPPLTGAAFATGSGASLPGIVNSPDFTAALTQALQAVAQGSGAGPVQDGGALPAASTRGQQLVDQAEKYLGTPYVFGSETLAGGGLDCSGLVRLSLGDMGVTDMPRVARDQGNTGAAVSSMDEAMPGDLLVFNGGTHIGIYAGDGEMIHASGRGGSVVRADVYEPPTAIRRVV